MPTTSRNRLQGEVTDKESRGEQDSINGGCAFAQLSIAEKSQRPRSSPSTRFEPIALDSTSNFIFFQPSEGSCALLSSVGAAAEDHVSVGFVVKKMATIFVFLRMAVSRLSISDNPSWDTGFNLCWSVGPLRNS